MISAAYIAGFFDGEGCISLIFFRRSPWKSDPSKSMFGFRLAIIIANTNHDILRIMQEQFGGHLHVGLTRNPNHKPVATLRFNSQREQRIFLNVISPHLYIKRRQCELALSYLDTVVKPGERISVGSWDMRRSIFYELKILNQRGVQRDSKNSIPDLPPVGLKPRKFYSSDRLAEMMQHVRNSRKTA